MLKYPANVTEPSGRVDICGAEDAGKDCAAAGYSGQEHKAGGQVLLLVTMAGGLVQIGLAGARPAAAGPGWRRNGIPGHGFVAVAP